MLRGWFKKNLILGIAIALLVGAVAIEGKLLLSKSQDLGAAKANVKSVTQDRDRVNLELASLRAAQKVLTTAHESCLNEVKVSQREQAVSAQQVSDLVKKVETTGAAVRSYRDKLYVEPNCDALQKFDLAAACPALAGSLRERARTLSSAPD